MAKLTLFECLSSVQSHLEKLVEAHAYIKEENQVLKKKNEELKVEISQLNTRVSDFKNQDKITKIVSNLTVEKEESTELKYKLNEYIKEIDKCITHLSE